MAKKEGLVYKLNIKQIKHLFEKVFYRKGRQLFSWKKMFYGNSQHCCNLYYSCTYKKSKTPFFKMKVA